MDADSVMVYLNLALTCPRARHSLVPLILREILPPPRKLPDETLVQVCLVIRPDLMHCHRGQQWCTKAVSARDSACGGI
jgi:hypothetical protein